jgi:hypothetical protein
MGRIKVKNCYLQQQVSEQHLHDFFSQQGSDLQLHLHSHSFLLMISPFEIQPYRQAPVIVPPDTAGLGSSFVLDHAFRH